MNAPQVVVGLGNPGREYEGTRHNVGFWLVDCFAAKTGADWRIERTFEAAVATVKRPARSLVLVKPLTYVNLSGRAVGAICRYFKVAPESVAVVYDEIQIELGRVKVSESGSAGGHNGISSLIEHLGPSFSRYRVGIGPKTPSQIEMKDFVLGRFRPEEQALLEEKKEELVAGLELLVDSGPKLAMNRINRKQRAASNERNDDKEELSRDLPPGHEGDAGVGGGNHRATEEGG